MLQLTKNDLVSLDDSLGAKVWWVQRPEKRQKVLLVGWTDAILVRPMIQWPQGLNPETTPGWAENSFRIDYLKDMERVSIQQIQKVPDVRKILEVKPKQTRALVPISQKKPGCRILLSAFRVEESEDEVVYVGRRSLKRVAGACGVTVKNLFVRLFEDGEQRMVLVYNRGLRGILGVVG